MSAKDEVGLVIVLYKPTDQQLERIQHIAGLYKGVIVDNSDCRNFETDVVGKMDYLPLLDNTGIAYAQNVGVDKLLENTSIKYLVFFDQDTQIEDDYPVRITEEFEELQNKLSVVNKKLAMLGPTVVEEDTGNVYKSKIHKESFIVEGLRYKREIISSGSCVPVEVWKAVGPNEAGLFIDHVEHEWEWRAQSLGYCFGESSNVILQHKVGKKILRCWKYQTVISAPIRYYYQYRNFILLLRRSYVPRQFKINTAVHKILELFIVPFKKGMGLKTLKFMLEGSRDGLWGKTGRIDGRLF